MSFKEKTSTVTLFNFSLILGFFLISVFQMIQFETFNQENVVRLWVVVIILAIVASILSTILTHIAIAILEGIRTGGEEPEIEDIEDERDVHIDLRGTKMTYTFTSFGSLIAMLTFALEQPPLVMFTLLIISGLVGQIAGDLTRVLMYRGRL